MREEMTFEEAMEKLNLIVRQMEQGDAALEQALTLFHEGTALVQFCNQKLADAKQKVQIVLAGADGTPVMENFTHEESI